jgi:organic radical activating enzyme
MKIPVAIENKDYDDLLSIDIYLTNVCNYSCHYCHPGLNEGDKRFPKDYELFVRNVDHLLNIYKSQFNKKRIKIELSGGEPTLWPKIGDFARHLKTNHPEIICISIITNASRTLRWWEEHARYFDEVHISLHAEGDPFHIVKIADYVYNNTDNHVSVNVMLDPTNWDQCISYLNTVVEHQTPWLVKSWLLVKGATVRQDYTAEQLEMFEDRVKKIPPTEYIKKMEDRGFISKPSAAKMLFDDGSIEDFTKLTLKRMPGDNNYQGWICNVGVDRVSLMFGKLIASCGATYLFNLEEPLSLYDDKFIDKFNSSIITPVICRELVCGGCTKDLRIPKKRIDLNKKIFPIINEK